MTGVTHVHLWHTLRTCKPMLMFKSGSFSEAPSFLDGFNPRNSKAVGITRTSSMSSSLNVSEGVGMESPHDNICSDISSHDPFDQSHKASHLRHFRSLVVGNASAWPSLWATDTLLHLDSNCKSGNIQKLILSLPEVTQTRTEVDPIIYP